jgi:hypothetical protein
MKSVTDRSHASVIMLLWVSQDSTGESKCHERGCTLCNNWSVGPFASVFDNRTVKVSADFANAPQNAPLPAGFIELADKNRKATPSNKAEYMT